ncbi:co-chaperone GroES [Candidatus Similichlamydia laticola]|uniref:Co-chaperonin GroES n=1 Tax=Candidatus Similichlamydia laticola TaxID=2170265 RepID=A0A369K969_9BACT|nr:co-chaperone GroES [Candidatus Similichlamydia laticola]RDB31139.1 Heat shock protein 60 family co-chaperone GroES [Candidatus Similichlamydia laticola]
MAKLKPLGNRVLIKRSASAQSKKGILIPETVKEKPCEGVVVRCGEEDLSSGSPSPVELKEGDRVLFSSYSGSEIQFEGEDFLVVSLKDILGILPS